jgi:N-carbamoylputrescine amidase
MRVTVCQLHEAPEGLEADWPRLVEHVRGEASDLVLLPEMPFHRWLARDRRADPAAWDEAVAAHERWLERLPELYAAVVLGTRPVSEGGRRFNEGFLWSAEAGCRPARRKYYLPDEEMFWEASWYERGERRFEAVEAAGARVGFAICTEMWFNEHARALGRQGLHLLAVPRATPWPTADKWLAGGRAAAVVSGAWCLSSNRGGVDSHGGVWAGAGWIIEPGEGEVLAVTSERRPFATLDIDLRRAEEAKAGYPRYVRE